MKNYFYLFIICVAIAGCSPKGTYTVTATKDSNPLFPGNSLLVGKIYWQGSQLADSAWYGVVDSDIQNLANGGEIELGLPPNTYRIQFNMKGHKVVTEPIKMEPDYKYKFEVYLEGK